MRARLIWWRPRLSGRSVLSRWRGEAWRGPRRRRWAKTSRLALPVPPPYIWPAAPGLPAAAAVLILSPSPRAGCRCITGTYGARIFRREQHGPDRRNPDGPDRKDRYRRGFHFRVGAGGPGPGAQS